MTLVSVVVTFDKTCVFQASRVPWRTVAKVVPVGISELTLAHAWDSEMNETPTLEVTEVCVNVKSAPSLAVVEL